MQNLNNLTAAYHTLGCKLNFAETSSLRDIMEREGVRTIEKVKRQISALSILARLLTWLTINADKPFTDLRASILEPLWLLWDAMHS